MYLIYWARYERRLDRLVDFINIFRQLMLKKLQHIMYSVCITLTLSNSPNMYAMLSHFLFRNCVSLYKVNIFSTTLVETKTRVEIVYCAFVEAFLFNLEECLSTKQICNSSFSCCIMCINWKNRNWLALKTLGMWFIWHRFQVVKMYRATEDTRAWVSL